MRTASAAAASSWQAQAPSPRLVRASARNGSELRWPASGPPPRTHREHPKSTLRIRDANRAQEAQGFQDCGGSALPGVRTPDSACGMFHVGKDGHKSLSTNLTNPVRSVLQVADSWLKSTHVGGAGGLSAAFDPRTITLHGQAQGLQLPSSLLPASSIRPYTPKTSRSSSCRKMKQVAGTNSRTVSKLDLGDILWQVGQVQLPVCVHDSLTKVVQKRA